MTAGQSGAQLREELSQVEDQLAELRDQVSELRAQIGDPTTGPEDAVERSALLTEAEQQEAVIDTLEQRRGRLREQLGEL